MNTSLTAEEPKLNLISTINIALLEKSINLLNVQLLKNQNSSIKITNLQFYSWKLFSLDEYFISVL